MDAERDSKLLARFGHVRCLSFSSDGRLLALGHEDASISVVDWISLRTLVELRCINLSHPSLCPDHSIIPVVFAAHFNAAVSVQQIIGKS